MEYLIVPNFYAHKVQIIEKNLEKKKFMQCHLIVAILGVSFVDFKSYRNKILITIIQWMNLPIKFKVLYLMD